MTHYKLQVIREADPENPQDLEKRAQILKTIEEFILQQTTELEADTIAE